MKEIITVKEKKWCASCEKVGIEGGKLHDEIDNKSNKLVCFFNNDEDLYYLYSLVSGNLITKSQNLIRCISDNYYAIAEDNHSSNRALYYIDHEENSRTQVDSNGIKFITNIFCYYENILIEYIDKKIHITDMYTGEKKVKNILRKFQLIWNFLLLQLEYVLISLSYQLILRGRGLTQIFSMFQSVCFYYLIL